jgi:hypothetical protein
MRLLGVGGLRRKSAETESGGRLRSLRPDFRIAGAR